MSTKQFHEGQQLWTFDFDAGRKIWSVYQVTFVHKYRSVCMIGEWCVVKNPDGSSSETIEDDLFTSHDDAVEALIKSIKTVRNNMHQDIEHHTKSIAKDWNAIDYCTDVIEKLEDDR